MAVLIEFLCVVRDCLLLVGQALLGRRHIVLQSRVEVAAPKEMIWDIMTAKTGRLEGGTPVNLQRETLNEAGSVYRTRTQYGQSEWETVYRVIDERAEEAQFAELLLDGEAVATGQTQGASHVFGFTLCETETGTTELVSLHELDGWRFADALVLAMSMRFMQRRIKLTCEERAQALQSSDVRNAASRDMKGVQLAEENGFDIDADIVNMCFAFTGVSLIMCGALIGYGQAALFLSAFVWHGYAISTARKMTGRETPLIAFLPMAWQFGVTESKPSEATERAFHSLVAVLLGAMPALCLTIAFQQTGIEALGVGAFIFALLSLMHLIPMMPFEGGRLVLSILDYLSELHRNILFFALLSIACVTALMGSFIGGALIAAGAFQISAWSDGLVEFDGEQPSAAPADSDLSQVSLIGAGYLALVGACLVMIAQLATDERLWPLLSGLPA